MSLSIYLAAPDMDDAEWDSAVREMEQEALGALQLESAEDVHLRVCL